MSINTYIMPTIILFVLIAVYWYLVFELIDHLLKQPRLTKLQRLPVGIFNTLIVFVLSALFGGTTTPYLLIIAVLFLEFKFFYKDTLLRNLFCTSACLIHVLAIRSITTGAFSLLSGYSIYEISSSPTLYAYSVLATFLFLNIVVGLVLRVLPMDKVRIVNEHRDQQVFMIIWLVTNGIYLLFNSAMAENPIAHLGVIINQIAAPCVTLIGTYIMLLLEIETGKLLGYKEKNAALELTISKEQEYRNSITKDAILAYEFNLTRDLIISGFEGAKDELGDMAHCYSDMLGFMARKFVHSEDIEDFAGYASPSHMIKEFEQGKSEMTVEYRRLLSADEYIWCRAVTNLARDTESGDIRGFTYIKNIDTYKRHQLELQHEAERDLLTGLYNKGNTGKLVAEHLLFNHAHAASALFMIDVDNFKDINDHMGHAYGDTVLCELGQKLSHIFRSDDIIGRVGGDEYIAYMKNGATDLAVREKAEEICRAFRTAYYDVQGHEYNLSSSVGVAVSPQYGTTFEELYNHADTALYAAKKVGKNNFRIYDGGSFSGYQANRE